MAESREIVVIAVFIIIFIFIAFIGFLVSPQIQNRVKEYFPDFFKNETLVDHSGTSDCPYEVARIENIGGWISNKNYISLSSKQKTKLYVTSDDLVYLSRGIWKDPLVGKIERNEYAHRFELVIDQSYLSEKGQGYLEYKEYLPSLSDLLRINSAFKPQERNYFCKDDQQIIDLGNYDYCKESCKLYNGVCKNEIGTNEVSFGNLDCSNNQLCAVTAEPSEKLEDNGLAIYGTKFYYYSPYIKEKYSSADAQFLDKLNFQVIGDNKKFISIGLTNTKTDKSPYMKPFCYIVRTDTKNLVNDYYDNPSELVNWDDETRGLFLDVGIYETSADKILYIVTFIPWENKTVYKKIKFVYMSDNHREIKTISNEEFMQKIIYTVTKTNDDFYVSGVKYEFGNDVVSDFKIEKRQESLGSKTYFYIYARNKDGDYQIMDCNKGYFSFASTKIERTGIKPTLLETLIHNGCTW